MYIVTEFLDIEITLKGGDVLSSLPTTDPRNPETELSDAVRVEVPAGAVGSEIRVLCERLQNSDSVEIDGVSVRPVKDLYLERSRAVRKFTPATPTFSVDLGLSAPKRAGTILAWLVSSQIEITDDVIVTYPFARNLSARVDSEKKDDGDDIVFVIGEEPKLDVTINLRAKDEGEEPDPDDRIYRILRALSPHGDFFFYGRNLSEAYIIGKSAQRAVKHVSTTYGREVVQPVLMEVL